MPKGRRKAEMRISLTAKATGWWEKKKRRKTPRMVGGGVSWTSSSSSKMGDVESVGLVGGGGTGSVAGPSLIIK